MGFEPTTVRLELFCSGPLSYGSKVDAYFGSRKATTLFQRSNSFFLEYCCCLASTFSAFFSRVVCGYHRICDVALTHGLVPCVVFPAGFEPALNAV